MFIGDGGTLMLGTLLTYACLYTILQFSSSALESMALGLAFTLAVLGILVFDTLRVMARRRLEENLPSILIKPIYISFYRLRISHIGTSVTIFSLQFLLVLIWY